VCRWLAYFGSPLRPEELVFNTTHSLIEQSRAARLSSHLTNADGFGLGWYGTNEFPGVYRSVAPAWSDRNLQELSAQIESPLFLAHVRAATGTPVQETNCHPFRHGRWLFVHNGLIDGYALLRRDLLLAVHPALFGGIEGTTDSELLFYLALTFGLDDQPLQALERMAGFVEATGRRHGVDEPLQMTLGVSDGERLYAVRYASGPVANSLYVSHDARDVRLLYPENERIQRLSDEARAVVSEPLADLPGLWREVPPSSAVIVQAGTDAQVGFTPRPPAGGDEISRGAFAIEE
jgi:predicted glutamine amidotransferase